MIIKRATIDDDSKLTELTLLSKAYWGYSDKQIEEWREELTISNGYIETNNVYKGLVNDEVVGYYSYFNPVDNCIRLDNLFILPDHIGKGFGRMLLDDFLKRVRQENIQSTTLIADPHAEDFYSKFGFVRIGEQESSIKNRYLPIMEKQI